jgi:hypothetical protein
VISLWINYKNLIDIEEIKNLKHRYFRAIDMADFDLLDNVFCRKYYN